MDDAEELIVRDEEREDETRAEETGKKDETRVEEESKRDVEPVSVRSLSLLTLLLDHRNPQLNLALLMDQVAEVLNEYCPQHEVIRVISLLLERGALLSGDNLLRTAITCGMEKVVTFLTNRQAPVSQ